MGYINTMKTLINLNLFRWEKDNYPLFYRYLNENHKGVSIQDVPCVLNKYLGPKGLRTILNGENNHETCVDVEHFLREQTRPDNKHIDPVNNWFSELLSDVDLSIKIKGTQVSLRDRSLNLA